MLKVKFKKMLKESGEQTDRNALAVIRTEFSKSVPNLDLVLNLAKDNEILTNYIKGHLKSLIDTEVSKKNPNLNLVHKIVELDETLKTYIEGHLKNLIDTEISKAGPKLDAGKIYKLSKGSEELEKHVEERLGNNAAFFENFEKVKSFISGNEWAEALELIFYDDDTGERRNQRIIEMLTPYFIEELLLVEDPEIPLRQLTDVENSTYSSSGDVRRDFWEADVDVDLAPLPQNLFSMFEDAIHELKVRYLETE
jgi:hypothetical protein